MTRRLLQFVLRGPLVIAHVRATLANGAVDLQVQHEALDRILTRPWRDEFGRLRDAPL